LSQSSRSAVKKFVTDNTSTTLPSGVSLFSVIQTSRYEPKVATLGATIVCWPGETRRQVTRLSLGRGGGQKLAQWSVQLMIIGTSSDEKNGLDQFQTVVDTIAESYETISLSPAPTITDPVDGGTSVITIIGETWSDVMYRPEFTGDQGRIVFRAIVTIPVTEYLFSA
jgi:hypothetical protein